MQIYLSIHRPDLAKKEFERSKRWAEDDLLLQLIESTISLVTGKDSYSDPLSFYTEQLGNPFAVFPAYSYLPRRDGAYCGVRYRKPSLILKNLLTNKRRR